jgi:hypothetical protein
VSCQLCSLRSAAYVVHSLQPSLSGEYQRHVILFAPERVRLFPFFRYFLYRVGVALQDSAARVEVFLAANCKISFAARFVALLQRY